MKWSRSITKILNYIAIVFSVLIVGYGSSRYLFVPEISEPQNYFGILVGVLFASISVLLLTNLKRILVFDSDLEYIFKFGAMVAFLLCLLFMYDGFKLILGIQNSQVTLLNGPPLAFLSFSILSYPIIYSLREEEKELTSIDFNRMER